MVNTLGIALHDYQKCMLERCSFSEIFFISALARNVPPITMKNLIMKIVKMKKFIRVPMKLEEIV
jgi:hypothetical protein